MLGTQQLALIDGFLKKAEIRAFPSYREAVRLAWKLRSRPNMTKAQLAEEIGAHAPHVTIWFHQDAYDKHGNKRADLPAEKIAEVESVLGNKVITQWLVGRGKLSLMEEYQADMRR